MNPIFLIGYMGCGKTTLGVELARQMGLRYIDLDDYIEAGQGMSITEIFDEMGEGHFRELEAEALQDVAAMTDVVVGCGGGTPCHGDNMALMNQAGVTVWLTTSPERITARLLLPDQKAKRPKISRPYYDQAQLQFDSTDIETAEATIITARHLVDLLQKCH